jgi:hypothetical protein
MMINVCRSLVAKPTNVLLTAAESLLGVARANLAATHDKPEGTTENDWAERHKHQSVLQQHLDFFDQVWEFILCTLPSAAN